MSLVYNNTTCEQAIFTYAFSGANLDMIFLYFLKMILRLMDGLKNIIWMNY